jgi:hypothetical protein
MGRSGDVITVPQLFNAICTLAELSPVPSHGATLRNARGAAHPPSDIRQTRVPSADVRDYVWRRAPFPQARFAFQDQLAELIREFFHAKWSSHNQTVHPYRNALKSIFSSDFLRREGLHFGAERREMKDGCSGKGFCFRDLSRHQLRIYEPRIRSCLQIFGWTSDRG